MFIRIYFIALDTQLVGEILKFCDLNSEGMWNVEIGINR